MGGDSRVIMFPVRGWLPVDIPEQFIPNLLGPLEGSNVGDHVSSQVVAYLSIGVAGDLGHIIRGIPLWVSECRTDSSKVSKLRVRVRIYCMPRVLSTCHGCWDEGC